MTSLYRFCIPRPLCCFLAGFMPAQVLTQLVATRPLPDWLVWTMGLIGIWSIISWRWTWVWRHRS